MGKRRLQGERGRELRVGMGWGGGCFEGEGGVERGGRGRGVENGGGGEGGVERLSVGVRTETEASVKRYTEPD